MRKRLVFLTLLLLIVQFTSAWVVTVHLPLRHKSGSRLTFCTAGTSTTPTALFGSTPLHNLLQPASNCNVAQMSGTDLAYIGDVVYELFVRSRSVWPCKRTADLQNQVVGLVRAEHQSLVLTRMKQEFHFSELEMQILMRGRNAVSRSSRRNAVAYQDATALEALIGYLYIADQHRCQVVLNWINDHLDDI